MHLDNVDHIYFVLLSWLAVGFLEQIIEIFLLLPRSVCRRSESWRGRGSGHRTVSGTSDWRGDRKVEKSVADVGLEKGGFQCGGQSLPGCIEAYLREAGGMPPQEIFGNISALRRILAHSGGSSANF